MFENVALVAEYPWRFGGAQRLLSTVAQRLHKPVYVLPEKGDTYTPSTVWETESTPIEHATREKVYLSIVIDKYDFRLFPGKRNIKFCHSAGTLENHLRSPHIKSAHTITHRPRVMQYYTNLGIRCDLIEQGYIPYDPLRPVAKQYTTEKKDTDLVICSRISQDKMPTSLLAALVNLQYSVRVVGGVEQDKYTEEVKRVFSDALLFETPDLREGFSAQALVKPIERSIASIHYSSAGLRDILEYSVLDSLFSGTVPICITNDTAQFSRITSDNIGVVIKDTSLIPEAFDHIRRNQEQFGRNIDAFQKKFNVEERKVWDNWLTYLSGLNASL